MHSNTFSILTDPAATPQRVIEQRDFKANVTRIPNNNVLRPVKGQDWGDVDDLEDDNDPFPSIGVDPIERKREDAEMAAKDSRIFQQSLSRKKWLNVGSGRAELRVSSQESYESLLHLITRYKSHDKNGRLNRREQEVKIKLTNSLLGTCYKIAGQPRFIFHIALIHLSNGAVLGRSQVTKSSTALFELEEHFYEPTA